MTLQTSGPISFQNLQAEFGGYGPISIGSYYRNGPYVTQNNIGIPTTGTINLNSFYSTTATSTSTYSTIDYYIGPTGVDSNAGTVVSPWAITSLLNPISRFATANGKLNWNSMVGKTIGLLPGTYNLYNLVDLTFNSNIGQYVVSEDYPILRIPSGTTASSTTIISCSSSGTYQANQAIIDVQFAPGANGGYAPGIGIAYGDTGYITIDGLTVQNGNGANIGLYGPLSPSFRNIIVQNCILHDVRVRISGSNPGLIRASGLINSIIRNNVLYNFNNSHISSDTSTWDLQFWTGDWGHNHGILSYFGEGNIYTQNTIYNTVPSIGIRLKGAGGSSAFNDNHNSIVSYNYIEISELYNSTDTRGVYTSTNIYNNSPVGYLPSVGIQDFASTTATSINYIHHNVVYASNGVEHGGLGTTDQYSNLDTTYIYNNTFYSTCTGGLLPNDSQFCYFGSSSTNGINWFNNIFYQPNNPSTGGENIYITTGTSIGFANYNCYTPAAANGNYMGYGPYRTGWPGYENGGSSGFNTYFNSSTWKTLGPGIDANSTATDPGLFNPTSILSGGGVATFTLTNTSTCLNAGKVNGILSGQTINIGAWDGICTQIGAVVYSSTNTSMWTIDSSEFTIDTGIYTLDG